MTKQDLRQLAERIATRLFTNGQQERARRLVLTADTAAKRDLGGWCFGAAVDQIFDELSRGVSHDDE